MHNNYSEERQRQNNTTYCDNMKTNTQPGLQNSMHKTRNAI